MQSEQAHVILSQNGEQKQVYSFTGQTVTTVGRDPENTISFLDDRCSRFHAKFFFSDGQWYIQDLGSRNGTFVDGTLAGSGAYPLQSGQRVQIGHAFLQFGCGSPGELDTVQSTGSGGSGGSPGHHSGVLGISTSLLGPAAGGIEKESEVIHQSNHASILAGDKKEGGLPVTKTGFGSIEMCRLAYQLGQAEDVDSIAKTALNGLLGATESEGVGLWLFPYSLRAQQRASDVRLVSSATINKIPYMPISSALVRMVFENQQAVLIRENPDTGTKTRRVKSQSPSDSASLNNTIVAPVRDQNSVLGILHLYTVSEGKYLDESDLEYSLAIADTIGVALAHINKQKELAATLTQARKENLNLREILQVNSEIVGNSPQMQMVHHLIARAAEGKTALLIRGESGTGKELIARAVHLASSRKSKPLICLNCAAISDTLLESELFGHEKGAFTGATDRKIGKFEAADSGTLFLDEIGEMTPGLQAKMLRVLETSSFERVGGNTTISVDVRIITATNRDLEKEVAAGKFRHDLFFRLRVLEIIVPPLRKRPTDIPTLAEFFLNRFCQETGKKYNGFDPAAMKTLMSYRWPGNVRELKNIIERAVVLGSDSLILEQDLLLSKLNTTGESQILTADKQPEIFIPLSLDDIEKNHIIRTLEHCEWNKSLAAKHLGIERTTLDRKIKRYNIES